ncbi:MAG: iron ABC transporter permease [Candidatus Cloacimonadaceae bacterium]|nr:iron ABC transporter permease [Candidatus Cloacimonadaceae bacterium]
MKRLLPFILLLSAVSVLLIGIYLFEGNADANIFLHVRIPRLILNLLTGMVLAGIGSVYQMMLANPLAEPYILGISSGSAFGAILFGVLGMVLLMPLGGFLGAGLTMLLVWSLAQKNGRFERSRLLISGVIAGMFFAAGISLLMYLYQKDTMIILGTLMGNLGRIFSFGEWRFFLVLTGISLVLLVFLYFKSSALDILSGGDIYAGSVGINVSALRKQIFVVSSILIGIVVAYAGIIGFVGLIIPHLVRFAVPSGQKKIYLLSLATGGIYLLACDLIAKSVTAIELPVGVVTAAIGCPFFMWLMLRKK